MNFLDKIFCEKKLCDVSDEAIEAELERRALVTKKRNHDALHTNVKRCLQYLDNCDAIFTYANHTGSSITIYYQTRVAFSSIEGILNDGIVP